MDIDEARDLVADERYERDLDAEEHADLDREMSVVDRVLFDVGAASIDDLVELQRRGLGEWEKKAACRGKDTKVWFPEHMGVPPEARHVCVRCKVKKQCLIVGLGYKFGIWAATTGFDRALVAERFQAAGGVVAHQAAVGDMVGLRGKKKDA